jgi:catechol 2,3-dioxygenase-like lactoylglutathione lyase family enzyme
LARFTVHGFNHTSFTVASLDRAIPFFCDFLGFELISRASRGQALIEKMTAIAGADVEIAFVRGPGHTIELVEYKAPADRAASRARLCDAGAAHSRSTSTTCRPRSRAQRRMASSGSARSS